MRVAEVGDLVEILEDGSPTCRKGVVLEVEVIYDMRSLTDRRCLHITGMSRPVPDSEVTVIEDV